MVETTRRHLLRGLGVILAAPAIVTASNLMPISAKKLIQPSRLHDKVFTMFTFKNGDKWSLFDDGSGAVFLQPASFSVMDMAPYLVEKQNLQQLIARLGKPWYLAREIPWKS